MPKRYQLIAVAVEAMKLEPENVERVAVWCGGVEVQETDALDSTKKFVALNIPTLRGVERATQGWYVIRDRNGAFSTMSPEEFQNKYEQI